MGENAASSLSTAVSHSICGKLIKKIMILAIFWRLAGACEANCLCYNGLLINIDTPYMSSYFQNLDILT